MDVRSLFGLIAALGLALAGGAEWHAWRARESLKANPCSVTTWNPNIRHFSQSTLPARFCLHLGPSQEVAGTWVDAPYSRKFTPDRRANFPASLDLTLDWPLRARIYWLAGLRGPPPEDFSGRTFHVSLVGRLGNRSCCWLGASGSTIVVDDVLAARGAPRP
jgi:hypothetical protein